MANEQITFDKLPQAVGYLTEQMEQIRQMVAALQPQTSSDKHRLVEIDEACKITRKAKPTIYTLARKGLIPAYKRGKKLYFYEDELLQWIESGRKQMQAMSLQEQAAEIVHGGENANQREAITFDLHGYGNLPINSRRYYRRGCAHRSQDVRR